MFRRDESSSDGFVDIELGEFTPMTQTMPDWMQTSHLPFDRDTTDQSYDTEPLLRLESSNEITVSISTSVLNNDSCENQPLSQDEASDGLFANCPNEVLLAIFANLTIENLISLSHTCDRLHSVIKDYINQKRQFELHGYRIRFFKQRQLDLNDEIDDINISKIKLKTVLGLIGVGTLLTAISSSMLQSTYNHSHSASRDEKIMVAILFVVSIAILLSGIISTLYNIKLKMNIEAAKNHIEKLEDNIRYDYTAQRHSRVLKLL